MARSKTNEKVAANSTLHEEVVVQSELNEEFGCEERVDKISGELEVESTRRNENTLASTVTISGDAASLLRKSLTNRSFSLERTATFETDDLALWVIIRKGTEAMSFKNYAVFMDLVLCGQGLKEFRKLYPDFNFATDFKPLRDRRFLPFNDTDAYRLLKVATEAFLTINCGVAFGDTSFGREFNQAALLPSTNCESESVFNRRDIADLIRRVNLSTDPNLDRLWRDYLVRVNGTSDQVLPYLALIRRKLGESNIIDSIFAVDDTRLTGEDARLKDCVGILNDKLASPCLLELIWSYWQEQGMLVQTMNALSLRFQNVRGVHGRDPLAMFETDPLRPLNNLLWGYIQDEQHRLTVVRRAYEYDSQYGLTLKGRAVPQLRTVDSRSKFIEALHNLLHLCSIFFKEDDDTTVIADGFPLMNALRDVHFVLAQGAHNQFGDLPSTARQEMLIQQWLLARPEFREFLPTRTMVAYPEEWMDRVDAMKTLQGWTDTSVLHFRNLAVFGEQLLLSIRYGNWGEVIEPIQAANWARYWRAEIQGYIHAYLAVTGVNLSSDVTDTRHASERYLQPSFHLAQRLAMRRNRQLPLPQRRF